MTLAVNIFFGLGYGKIDPKIDPKIFEPGRDDAIFMTYVMGNFFESQQQQNKKSLT